MGSDRRARSHRADQGFSDPRRKPWGCRATAPVREARSRCRCPGLRAQERDAVLPRSREHVFPACSWDLPPVAPFPLALFLISGNHLPLLLLLTACDSIFSSLSGRKKNQQPTFARSLTPTPSWGTCYPSLEKARTPKPIFAQDMLDLAGCPPHLQLVLDPVAGRRSQLRPPPPPLSQV